MDIGEEVTVRKGQVFAPKSKAKAPPKMWWDCAERAVQSQMHGTTQLYAVGCRCVFCRRAQARYQETLDLIRQGKGV